MDIGGLSLVCEPCSKKCKTKGGLKLHHKKHSIDAIDDNKIHEKHYVKEAIENACKNVLEEKFHSGINEVEKCLDITTENGITDLQNKPLILNFHGKELFYSKHYSQIVHRSKKADVLQAGLKEIKDTDETYTNNLNKKELVARQYFGGYVISNLYIQKTEKFKKLPI